MTEYVPKFPGPSVHDAKKAVLRAFEDRLVVSTWDNVTQFPAWYDLQLYIGADFTLQVEWTDGEGLPRDVSGHTLSLAFRKHPSDASALATITPTGASSGIITINATAAVTANYDWTRAAYDLKATSGGGVVTRLLEGNADLHQLVTQ